jgi:hypothetical protein
VLFVVSALLASVLRELFLLLPKHPSKLIRSSRESISTLRSLVPVSKSFARISSVVLLNQLRRSSAIPRSTSRTSWSVVPLVSLVSSNLFPTFSTARSPTRASTLMRLLPMVLPSRLPSYPVTPLRRLKTFSSTLLLFPSVLRLPEVS